jgi:hypothetical protein
MPVGYRIEAVTDFIKFFNFFQDFFGGHGLRGFLRAFKEVGPAFDNAVSPLLYTSY